MRFCKDALVISAAGIIVGMHFFLVMSPKAQKEIERGLRKTVREMKELSEQMVRLARQFG